MQAMSPQAAGVVKSLPLACELSGHVYLPEDSFTESRVERGAIDVPRAPGCGMSLSGAHAGA